MLCYFRMERLLCTWLLLLERWSLCGILSRKEPTLTWQTRCELLSDIILSERMTCAQDGCTPLYEAAHNNQWDCVMLLLEGGANIDQPNKVCLL